MSRTPALWLSRWLPLLALATACGAAGAAPPAECGASFAVMRVEGDLLVPEGVACALSGTRVDGSVRIARGGSFSASGVRIGGDVIGERQEAVALAGGSVGGGVRLEQGGAVSLNGVVIGGDVRLRGNAGEQRLRDNRIGGGLLCQANARTPQGTGNVVAGRREGQCARL